MAGKAGAQAPTSVQAGSLGSSRGRHAGPGDQSADVDTSGRSGGDPPAASPISAAMAVSARDASATEPRTVRYTRTSCPSASRAAVTDSSHVPGRTSRYEPGPFGDRRPGRSLCPPPVSSRWSTRTHAGCSGHGTPGPLPALSQWAVPMPRGERSRPCPDLEPTGSPIGVEGSLPDVVVTCAVDLSVEALGQSGPSHVPPAAPCTAVELRDGQAFQISAGGHRPPLRQD